MVWARCFGVANDGLGDRILRNGTAWSLKITNGFPRRLGLRWRADIEAEEARWLLLLRRRLRLRLRVIIVVFLVAPTGARAGLGGGWVVQAKKGPIAFEPISWSWDGCPWARPDPIRQPRFPGPPSDRGRCSPSWRADRSHDPTTASVCGQMVCGLSGAQAVDVRAWPGCRTGPAASTGDGHSRVIPVDTTRRPQECRVSEVAWSRLRETVYAEGICCSGGLSSASCRGSSCKRCSASTTCGKPRRSVLLKKT